MRDPLRTLDEAVGIARQHGHAVTGWTLQQSDDGYAAWLYEETAEEQLNLFPEVELCDFVAEAAEQCLQLATELAPPDWLTPGGVEA